MEGKTDLAEFIVNRGPRVVAEVLATAWEMENSNEHLERARKTRIELLFALHKLSTSHIRTTNHE